MRLARRYGSGVVPTQQPTRGPGTDAVDFAAFTPIAAWVRTRDGEPALRTMCAAAGIDAHLLTASGGSLPLARFEAFLAALREHTGSDDALLVASGAAREAPGRGRWLRWFATPGLLYRSRAWAGWLTGGGGRIACAAHGLGSATMRYTGADYRVTVGVFASAFRRAATGLAPPARTGEPAMPAAASTGAPDEGCVLRQEGDFWRITFERKTVLIQSSRGLSLLVHLLRNPGAEIRVTTLAALVPSDAEVPTQTETAVHGEIVRDLGDAGDILDAQAKAAYRGRVGELREELRDSEACNDLGRASSARAELEAIAEQLRGATGLGGRSRRASSSADRVRVAVTRRIRAAIAQIAKHHAPLGAHLTSSIRTGYSCSYEPADKLVWRT